MADIVLDASLTISWFVPDEATQASQTLLTRVVEEGALVPLIWPVETANALTMATRRRRISVAQRNDALAQLTDLQIMSDADTFTHVWSDTLALADRFRLTLYDACYLELAQRRRLPLASLDQQLRTAAGKLGLDLLGV